MVAAITDTEKSRLRKKYRDFEADRFMLGYQAKWIKSPATVKLFDKSRQIGISWATGYSITRMTGMKGAQTDAWISSRDDIQARLFKENCNAFAKILQRAASDLGEVVIDDSGKKKITAYILEFANKRRIHSMSSNPDAQAGKVGHRVLDEFALHPDPRKLYAIAEPGITWGGGMDIISTQRGTDGFFNILVKEIVERGNPKDIDYHKVTLQDALEYGLLWKLQQKLPKGHKVHDMDEAAYFDSVKSRAADQESFLREYMCVASDDAAAFLEFDLIDAVTYADSEVWELELRGLQDLYVGVDIGRKKDLTVIWVLQKVGGVFFTRRVIELSKVKFSAQESVLYPILALPGVRRCCIDNTGLGMQFAERAQEKFGSYRVEPVTFTGPVKEELAYPVRSMFEDKNVRIPNEQNIISDLRSIKKETTPAGNIRFQADASENGHADRFWALALARHASSNASGEFRHQFSDVSRGDIRKQQRSRGRRSRGALL